MGPAGCVSVFPDPVAASTTVAPLIGFPRASFAVTVIVEELAPVLAVIVPGEAPIVDCDALTLPALTFTVVLFELTA